LLWRAKRRLCPPITSNIADPQSAADNDTKADTYQAFVHASVEVSAKAPAFAYALASLASHAGIGLAGRLADNFTDFRIWP
jgi:hypothetical protein